VSGAVVGAAGGELDPATSAAIESRRGAGNALPAGVRRRMEGAFGGSFSSVRVHDDATATGLSRAVSARAFTVGADIFFDRGQFAPDTAAGERVLAHELAHTRQPEAGARRTLRRMIDPDSAHDFAAVMDEILRDPKGARGLADQHHALLKARAADGPFTGRLDGAMRLLLQQLATADTNLAADLTDAVDRYKETHDNPTWTHVAGASFTPQRQRAEVSDGSLFEDVDAETEFKDGTGQGLSDLDALIRFATIEIDKANGKHQAELALPGITAPDRAATVMVFLGPEWMFSNRQTPVSPPERDSTIEKFRKLSVLYPQMVLVPGTIRSGKPRKAKKHTGHWKDIRNTVFVVWNGRVVHTHDKQGDVGDTNVASAHPAQDPVKRYGGSKKDKQEMAKDPIFQLANLKFAIEICGDHFDRRAQKALGTDPAANVHLVTAAGTTPQREKSATGPNGGIMLGSDVDGSGPTHRVRGAESPALSNLAKNLRPPVATSAVVGGVVNPPVRADGDQMLTGHAADKGQKKFQVLTYYARQQV
jgi:hypothetical protein